MGDLVEWLCQTLVAVDTCRLEVAESDTMAAFADQTASAVFMAMGGFKAMSDPRRKSRPENVHCILEERLYMGGSAVDEEDLRHLSISHVLRVLEDEDPPVLPREEL